MTRLGVILIIALLVGGLGSAAAQTPDDLVVTITSPANGEQLFGLATISGSAEHPSLFNSYTLEYDSLGDTVEQWFLVQERVTQQVQNDVLGAWNTNSVPDGVYQLRLRVYLNDGQSGDFIVSNLRVINSEPTPVPTAASGSLDTELTPTPGPSPTSPVEQPPSINPSIDTGAGLAEVDINSAEPESSSSSTRSRQSTRINLGRARTAFCAGVYVTLIGFAVMLVYVFLRNRLRPYSRVAWQDDSADRQ